MSPHQRVLLGDQINLVSVPDRLQSSEDKNKPGKKSSEAILRVMPGKVEELIEKLMHQTLIRTT